MSADLTAAASRYTSRKIRGRGIGDQSWQYRAWDMYHAVPEVRFAAGRIGNAMAGARLFAGRRADDGTIEPAPANHRATEIVSQIAGGPDGQSKMLGAFGRHLTVPGEGWIIVRPNADVLSPYAAEDGHDWRVLSVKEVRQQQGKLIAEIDGDEVPIPEGDPAWLARRSARPTGTPTQTSRVGCSRSATIPTRTAPVSTPRTRPRSPRWRACTDSPTCRPSTPRDNPTSLPRTAPTPGSWRR